MTAAVIATGLLIGTVQQAGLPLQDPLNWWIYMLETESEAMLPGTFPLVDSHFLNNDDTLTGSLGSIERFLFNRSGSPTGSRQERSALSLTGTVAGEVLYNSDSFETRTGTTARIFADILPGLYLDERLSIWAGSDESPPDYFSPYHEGMEKGRHLYVDWGYLRWDIETVSLSFGRIPQKWGPGRYTQLLISDNSPPLDMLKVQFNLWNTLKFTGFTSTINSDSGTYLTTHRLDISPRENLRIGLCESILFKAEGLDFAYMNPVIPWYPVQWNERLDDNAFFSFDVSWKPFRGIEAYGELLIDDIQYENIGERPNKLGWTAGLSACFNSLDLGTVIEYTRIDRYVYSQRRLCNYYLHHGEIIGSELGPDADRVTLSLGTSAAWPLLGEITLDHTRHGEGTVTEGWPDSASTSSTFPSGTVEYITGAELHLGWYPLDFLEIHGNVGNEWVRNQNHVSGESSSEFSSFLEIIYNW
ncbi:MAG: capsule assembly Wzi family protein [Candidatus Aegiribacteria sp.]|nr:capsule assembly Wzi family protein [Candidatus Aegiribacteria sp.]